MKFVVIGGAGAMGQITVRDLVEFSNSDDQVIIADFNLTKAQELVEQINDPRVSAVQVDVTKLEESAKKLKGSNVIINSVQYQLNPAVMELALEVGAHYVDLGGLFHMTRTQMEFDERFKKKNLLAILGMGAAPGITNILSRFGADKLEKVTEIHTRVAGRDSSRYAWQPALPVSYSLQTILEEFSYKPAVYTKGEFTFVEPMSGDKPHRFPNPVGVRKPMYTIHSEVATLPLSFKSKGVKEVSFKIAFDQDFLNKVRFLRDMGLASHEPVSVSGSQVKPIELVNRVAMAQPPAKLKGKPKQHEIVRAIVKGYDKAKRKVTYILDCHTTGMPRWGVGTDINTGTPPAIAALMIASGEIEGTGTLPPEVVVPCDPFFKALKKRNMHIKVAKKSGWGVAT